MATDHYYDHAHDLGQVSVSALTKLGRCLSGGGSCHPCFSLYVDVDMDVDMDMDVNWLWWSWRRASVMKKGMASSE